MSVILPLVSPTFEVKLGLSSTAAPCVTHPLNPALLEDVRPLLRFFSQDYLVLPTSNASYPQFAGLDCPACSSTEHEVCWNT